MLFYTLYSFIVFKSKKIERQQSIFRKQNFILFTVHLLCFSILFMTSELKDPKDWMKLPLFYCCQVLFFILTIVIYKLIYKKLSRLILNNMLFCLMISFVVLTRLSYEKAVKQLIFATIGLLGCLIIPYLIRKMKALKNMSYLYAGVGIALLALVLIVGKEQYGAKNWIFIGNFGFQPSEFVKILYIFFLGSFLAKSKSIKNILYISIIAAVHVLILVVQKDLGGALIYFVTYLMMVYVATNRTIYLFGGLMGGTVAATVAYRLFNHVRVRVTAWKDPWSVIDNQGYQITQSLFAIGTGGWFGMGLTKGLPTSIPVVTTDFIFSAISEEFGGIFAICLVLICLSCFLMFINIAMKMKEEFYKYVAFGLAVMYGFQVFLTLGGVTKLIPSTGVTLPLVSYGGSSVLSTIIIFSIIQGLYVLNQDEDDTIEREKTKRKRRKEDKSVEEE